MSTQPAAAEETAQEEEAIFYRSGWAGFVYHQIEEYHREPLLHYRPRYLHPVAVGDSIRPDSARCPNRPADAPTGYRILHKLGHGGEATVWLAQGVEASYRRLVSLKVYSAHCSSAAEREARALSTSMATSNAPWAKHVLFLLDSFIIQGPNGIHHVHITDVVLPIVDAPPLSAGTKKDLLRGVARGLAHLHRCGYIHGDVHIGNVGCTMPPSFASAPLWEAMRAMYRYEVMMVLPVDPTQSSATLPAYLLSPCALSNCYRDHVDKDPGWCPEARIFDLGNARQTADADNVVEDVRWACPPPEAAFAHYALGGREILPTTATDVWCLGAMMTIIFSGMPISQRTGKFRMLDYALLDGVLPPAWRQFWEADPKLGPITVTPTESAEEWRKLRQAFMQQNPDFDGTDLDCLTSLLRRMLALDSAARPSMEEVLADPWFADARLAAAGSDPGADADSATPLRFDDRRADHAHRKDHAT
ncbi:kinase-like protein [Lentinus brumalis]|uniref:Kinase-like protein n=1 Tax=Lentinus brumalis TaxID=2498619 RepID=A0A371DWX5_9APHY|nr:kinase-like protein [Polyporus brumalis]